MSSEVVEEEGHPHIGVRRITDLDRLVQILEISFIFLLIFSLIALLDTVLLKIDFYKPIANDFWGQKNYGPLDGANVQSIVRVTLIFNALLFTFSLLFGLWMRKTRDNWEWSQMGYTLSTPGYSFKDLLRRGTILGLIAVLLHFSAQIFIFATNSDLSIAHAMVFFDDSTNLIYTPRQLNAHYYFGFVEMGLIWPLSAGFFFFAYAHTSLDAKFPTGIANVISTLFYVFYLQFFFMIPQADKITRYGYRIQDPIGYANFWIMSIVLFVILYINFSAFAETKSIVLPFLMNFVFNAGITLIQSANALLYDDYTNLMFIPYFLIILSIGIWYYLKPSDFSTIRLGMKRLGDIRAIPVLNLIGYFVLFVSLSFLLPGIINELLFKSSEGSAIQSWLIPVLYAINFIILIILATVVLTYDPTDVWDVLLISKDGTPVASHIEIFETNDVLISGFITALTAVDQELSSDGGLSSIKRGQREIIIEEGVLTRVIALVDKDQPSIRQTISKLHKEFEVKHLDVLNDSLKRTQSDDAKRFVTDLGDLSVTFNIPTQTRWISSVSLAIAPLMIALIGLI